MKEFEEWLEENYPKGPMLRTSCYHFTNRDQIEQFMKEAFEAGYIRGFDDGYDYVYGS